MIRRLVFLAWFASVAVLGACEDGGTSAKPYGEQESALFGIWVSSDIPDQTWVLELVPFDPYLDALSGVTPVYRMWEVGTTVEPRMIQAGSFAVTSGRLDTTVVRSQYSDEVGKTYSNDILEHDPLQNRLVLSSTTVPGGIRTLARVEVFPGGDYVGGDTVPVTSVQPVSRVALGFPTPNQEDYRGYLFRTGAGTAVASRAVTTNGGTVSEFTMFNSFVSDDSGGTWTEEPVPPLRGYTQSEARFKEQTHARPLIFPINSLSEYFYLWSPELGRWEEDNEIQVCREAAGFPDRDIVLSAWHDISYSICVASDTDVMIHRRFMNPFSEQIQALSSPVERVKGQWMPDDGPLGTLYVLLFSGGTEPGFRIYAHEETGSTDFPPDGFTAPIAEIAFNCGEIPCELTDLKRYYIVGGTHHIVATARFEGPRRAHPLAPENELALHIHGTPGGSFETEVLNLRRSDGRRFFLGNLVDVDFPAYAEAEAELLVATLQDVGCVRILRSSGPVVDWQPAGVIPTAVRPQEDSVIAWGTRLGMISASPSLEYVEFEPIQDEARCPALRTVE